MYKMVEGKLNGKVAIVTGCARGNGLGAVRCFCRYGAKVVMLDVLEEVFTAAQELKEDGYDVLPIQVDLTDAAQLEAAVQQAAEHYGKFDVLVNNAGVSILSKFLETPQRLIDLHFNVNLFAVMHLCKLVLPYMVKQNYGRIVNVSSVTGPYVSDEGEITYGITKAGVIGLTKGLALEFAKHNITVNAICPGYIHTPMVDGAAKQSNPENPQAILDGIARTVPLGRLGTPDEIGELISFLASDESSYITGIDITIDGGAALPETNVIGIR